MRLQSRFMRFVALVVAFAMTSVALPVVPAQAAMMTTDQVIEGQALADERARVMDFMAREDVRRQFQALGIDPDEAARRTANLSDAEIQDIAGRMGELPAGQDALGVIIGAILIVLLVLLITDLLGVTNVFPFVKSQRVN